MPLSAFDLFSIGIGPSSSHTVGPMRAALRFVRSLETRSLVGAVATVRVDLYGSLALTGRGHATDRAVVLGLLGQAPESVDPDAAPGLVDEVGASGRLTLPNAHAIAFDLAGDLRFRQRESLPHHPNGMAFEARDADGAILSAERYYSVGGGFVVSEEEAVRDADVAGSNVSLPIPFRSGAELLEVCGREGLTIAEVMLHNERVWRDDEETRSGLREIWVAMNASIRRGCAQRGELPGGLSVRRRAHDLHEELMAQPEAGLRDPLTILDWVNLFALAVNEENAAGGRVVTAPTNGAAGVVPAVLAYYDRFVPGSSEEGIFTILLTAAAIGTLYKRNASISAAEVGCQGEVGVACSMAAAGLAAVLGGTNEQVENAAEIGMEHNLGLTCDPIAGLVQIPCIERNTMGAVKAINAARLAMRGDGTHKVALDRVIETMRQTGVDMQAKYKETSLGGLAVNVIEC
jgi:L-serine dehydratase